MERASWVWARMRDVGGGRLWLLAQTAVVLLVARAALRMVPAAKILAWQAKGVRATGTETDRARRRKLVAWAVDVLARRSPVAFVCFPRCLAASFLLRARGVESRLHYGAAREAGRLVTHTWLESGGEVLVGGEVKAAYATLAVYGGEGQEPAPLKSFHKLFEIMWAAARWQTVAAVALSTALSLTEGVSLAAIFPLIALLGDGSGTPAGPRTQLLFRLLAATGLARAAWLPVLLVALVAAVGLLAHWNGLLMSLEQRVLLRVQERLALQIFDAVLHADWAFLARRRGSDLTHLLINEVLRVGQLSANVLSLLANGMVTLLLLGVAATLAPPLTLVVGLCFGVLIPLQRRSRRRMAQGGEALSVRSRAVYDSAAERLGHLKTIKAYGAQDAELTMFRERYGAVSEALMANLWRRNAAARHFQLLSMGLLCGILLLGLRGLHLPAVSMLVFLAAFMRMVPRLNMLQMSTGALAVDLPALRSVETLLRESHERSEQRAGDAPAPELKSSLTMRGVGFAYGTNVVLDGLDLDIPAGRMTAIAGFSGAGKSTVADLLLPLLFPSAGKIAVDGVAIDRSNAKSWRLHVGYVSQDTLLFHASVRANLLWARPEADEDDLCRAIEAAQAGFVWELSGGLEATVGDRGTMLSHGQRQRLALARAFLLHPQLLILDEATNSLDLENEESVLRTVAGKTVLLISHRPSALRLADRIYVLEHGRVQAAGSWEEVRARVEVAAGEQGLSSFAGAETTTEATADPLRG